MHTRAGLKTIIHLSGFQPYHIMSNKSFIIGRLAPSDLIPKGDRMDTVSASHARLEINDGFYQIFDLNSTNGLYVKSGTNWRRVTKAQILRHTPIRLGYLETSIEALFKEDTTSTQAYITQRF